MKFLICGLGSIGQRHVRNLKKLLPSCQIIAFRNTKKNIASFEKKFKIKTFYSLDRALLEKPDAAFITNPTILHVKTAIACAEAKIHLFIEKPLSNNLDNIDELESIIKRNKLICMIGFMMKYHPAILKINELIKREVIGRVVSATFINGEYLPSWHPWEDYRKSYSARKDLGGGVILTFSHEIDYASWLFGKVKSVFCMTNKSKILETNVEDSAEILVNYKNGITANIHLDHISQPPLRTISVIGEKGRIFWDYYDAKVEWYNSLENRWLTYTYKFERNDMFVEELKEFTICLKTRKMPLNNFSTAKENLRIALSIKQSDKLKKSINL